jgi:uncharacterized coiled-coil protein SlyX
MMKTSIATLIALLLAGCATAPSGPTPAQLKQQLGVLAEAIRDAEDDLIEHGRNVTPPDGPDSIRRLTPEQHAVWLAERSEHQAKIDRLTADYVELQEKLKATEEAEHHTERYRRFAPKR